MSIEMTAEPDLTAFRTDHSIQGEWHYIYGLCDPRDGELRYIGKSDQPQIRLRNQMNERAQTHRCHWLQELRRLRLRPAQIILDAVPSGSDWRAVEKAYIAAARNAGYHLTNGTAGGDGVPELSGESLRRVRTAWLGRKHRPESLEKIGAASRGRYHTAAWRKAMQERMQGREFTAEHRIKIRDANQKLTADQVREIRHLLSDGIRQRDIAACFHIHQGSVSNIARGLTYQHVDSDTRHGPEEDR